MAPGGFAPVLAGVLLLAVALPLAGCRSPDLLDPAHAGRSLAYGPGALAFDVEAVADAAGLDVRVSLPVGGGAFSASEAAHVARIRLDLALYDPEEGLVARQSWSDTVRVDPPRQGRVLPPYQRVLRLDAPAGTFRLEAILRDEATGRHVARAVRVTIPAPGQFSLGMPLLEGSLPGDTLRPLVSLHIPARLDSLLLKVASASVPTGNAASLMLHVIRFETDTLAAEIPYGYTGLGSLAYRGVRLERRDTVHFSRQPLAETSGAARVAFGLPRLAPGLYRLVVEADGVPGAHRQERLLAVKPPDFPHIRTMAEMVEALGYLLTRRERRRFAEAKTPEAQRELFDRFWGRELANRGAAATRIRRYYARAEEANLRFSGYKAGWKTDRGMVYIVLGPPIHAEVWPDREIWYYSYDEGDDRYAYRFERVHAYDAETPFEQFVLVRSGAHQRPWTRAVQAWRNADQ